MKVHRYYVRLARNDFYVWSNYAPPTTGGGVHLNSEQFMEEVANGVMMIPVQMDVLQDTIGAIE